MTIFNQQLQSNQPRLIGKYGLANSHNSLTQININSGCGGGNIWTMSALNNGLMPGGTSRICNGSLFGANIPVNTLANYYASAMTSPCLGGTAIQINQCCGGSTKMSGWDKFAILANSFGGAQNLAAVGLGLVDGLFGAIGGLFGGGRSSDDRGPWDVLCENLGFGGGKKETKESGDKKGTRSAATVGDAGSSTDGAAAPAAPQGNGGQPAANNPEAPTPATPAAKPAAAPAPVANNPGAPADNRTQAQILGNEAAVNSTIKAINDYETAAKADGATTDSVSPRRTAAETEIGTLTAEIDKLQTQRNGLNDSISNAEREYKEAYEANETYKSTLGTLKTERETATTEKNTATEKISGYETQIASLRTQIKPDGSNKAEIEGQIKELEEQIALEKENIKRAETKIKAATDQEATIMEKLNGTNIPALYEAMMTLKNRAQELDSKISSMTGQRNSLDSRFKAIQQPATSGQG